MAGKAGAVPPEYTDAMTDVNAATDELATYVDGLRGTIKTSMTQAEVTAATQGLQAVSSRLRGIAKDPNEPVPPPDPNAPVQFKRKP
jgi:hypothetical protein